MKNSGIRHSVFAAASLFLLVAVGTGAVALAQTLAGSATDLQMHKFQPRGAPERAADSASISDRTAGANGISRFAANQMRALQQEKDSRTPAQQKIDSNILYTERMLQGQEAAPGVPFLDTGVDLDANNHIVVDMVANVTDSLLSSLSAAGAKILYSNVGLRSIRATLPPDKIEEVAASPDVIFISPRQESRHGGGNMAPVGARARDLHLVPGFAARAASVRRMLGTVQAASTPGTPITWQGSVGTEGDLTHQALDARGTFGINGAGLKIGVLSDGVTSAALSQATKDLPPTCGTPPCLTVLTGQAGAGDEGTAMLEIIHDMVPGANLFFATADNSITSFAANIRALQAAGCNVIVDDVFYFVEAPFQDGQTAAVVSTSQGGVVTQAVNDVVAQGVFYFTAAGNDGGLDAGTSGTFEGDFVPQAAASPLPTGNVHNFGSGNGFDTITSPGEQVVGLFWADPLGGSHNDYDLYLLNSTGASILGASTNIQNGAQDPVELIGSANVINNNRLVVFQHTGALNRFFHLILFGGRLAVATSGETHGHSAASGAYTVAATPASVSAGVPTTNGPFPGPFVFSDQTETFSSDGLRHIFFNGDSTAITPGNFSASGGSVLNKPDFTAADGVSVTGVGGFGSPFYGTSASAPSAASVAALVLSAEPTLDAAQMKTALTSTAIDILAPGFDRDSGHGIVMALAAVESLGVSGSANLELAAITATENPGNGNGIIEAGEGALLNVQLQNLTGVKPATGISAALSSSTPGVIIMQPGVSAYADMPVGTGPVNNLSPFAFTLADNAACGTLAQFTLTVTYSGGLTRVLNFSVQTGMLTITNTLGSTPVVPFPVTFATGLQVSRINRNGVVSACGTAKAFPGAITGSHTFDSYSFPSCQAVCFSPQLDAKAAGINLFESLYSPSFTPASIGTNYSGDAGLSTNLQTFGVELTTGTNYTVVVNDVGGNPPPSPAPPNTYTIQLPSCAFDCNPYPLPVALAHDVTVTASGAGTANANVNNGSNDPDGGPITLTQLPAGPYPVGLTSVVLTVTNKVGAFAQASATVTVNPPPASTTAAANATTTYSPGAQNVRLTATVTGGQGILNSGSVTFTVLAGQTVIGSPVAGTVANGAAAVNYVLPAGTGAGNYIVQAAYGDVGGALGPSSGNASFTIAPALPTLSFAPIAAQTYGNLPFAVSASSASSGAVTYAVVSGPATITGNIVTLTGTGSVVLSASQAASGNYAAATANASFTVATAIVPTLTFAPIAVQTFGNPPFAVSASSASSGAVTYTVGSGPASIAGSMVTLTGVGTVVLGASQAASGNYAAATASTSFTVAAPLSFTLTNMSGNATVLPGGTVAYNMMLAPGSGSTFPDPVTLSATGLPSSSTVTFQPATIPAGSGATAFAMTIQTSNPLAAYSGRPSGRSLAPMALAFLLLPMAGIKPLRRRLGKMPGLPVMLAAAALSLGAMVCFSGCGSNGGFFNQAAQSYTVVVTATDTVTNAHTSANVTLTVQ
jgi:Subtilase family